MPCKIYLQSTLICSSCELFYILICLPNNIISAYITVLILIHSPATNELIIRVLSHLVSVSAWEESHFSSTIFKVRGRFGYAAIARCLIPFMHLATCNFSPFAETSLIFWCIRYQVEEKSFLHCKFDEKFLLKLIDFRGLYTVYLHLCTHSFGRKGR